MAKKFEVKFKIECDWFLNTIDMIDSSEFSSSVKLARLRKLTSHFDNLTEAYECLLEVVTDSEVVAKYDEQYKCATLQYDKLEAKATEHPHSQGTYIPTTSAPFARLPQINLQTFDGDLFTWCSFISLYNSLVSSRTDISKTEKFHYLFSHLQKEPRSMLQHLPMVDSSLDTALELLKARYDNKRLLADTHISRILNIPVLKKVNTLRTSILNPLLESTRALKGLGLPVDSWCYMLVHISLSKLPIDIRTRFEQKYGGLRCDLPTFENLTTFLQNECSLLETTTTGCINSEVPKTKNINSVSVAPYSTDAKHRCAFCSIAGHDIDICYKFKNGSSGERRMWIRNNGLCFKCFGQHSASSCNRHVPCGRCGNLGHHTLICTLDMQPSARTAKGAHVQNNNSYNKNFNQSTRNERMVHTVMSGHPGQAHDVRPGGFACCSGADSAAVVGHALPSGYSVQSE
ncbi:uncharacterized protein LOC126374682 [Pectinophora gossypiella]|uniref:uncharacterized protein LOC126374682 n=1 Tax=Pectinophora gossypiella TaxID=13191 RepID=UPI00214E8D25|nr:uncharacterized protein LOC126374682 [Pectinophora gossypiella]